MHKNLTEISNVMSSGKREEMQLFSVLFMSYYSEYHTDGDNILWVLPWDINGLF